MCGRYLLLPVDDNDEIHIIIDEINRKYHQPISIGEIFPGTNCAVLAGEPTLGLPATPLLAHWGFTNPMNGGLIINARSETLLTRPMFKNLALDSRCIIPASGYYEWQPTDNKKCKKHISTGNQILYMAGLLGTINIKGIATPAFVVITTAPAPQIASIHDRMPALLTEEVARIWLNKKLNVQYFEQLLTPYSGEIIVTDA